MPETFTQMRPIFLLIVLILLVYLFLSFIKRSQSSGVTLFAVGSVSVLSFLISTILLIIENQLVELTGLEGDSLTVYLYGAAVVLSILNPLVYRNRNKRQSTYTFY